VVSSENLTALTCSPSGATSINPGDKLTCSGTYSVTGLDLEKGELAFTAQATSATLRTASKTVVTTPAKLTMEAKPQLELDVDAGSCTVTRTNGACATQVRSAASVGLPHM
jgi:hypothetical protein